MTDKLTIEGLVASVSLEEVVGRYVDLKPNGNEYEGLCPFHSENTPSFYVIPEKGFYHCFGCAEHGDVIDFVANYHNINRQEKGWLSEVAKLMGVDRPEGAPAPEKRAKPKPKAPDWKPIIPVPDDAPRLIDDNGWTCDIYNPKRAGTDKEWTRLNPVTADAYRQPDGKIMGVVLRCEFEREDGKRDKFTPQVTFCENSAGERRWAIVPMPDPRPLLGLRELAEKPDHRVCLVEGEKARSAARQLLPSDTYVVMTWPGGSKAVKHVDWTPLEGRAVLLWPDADAKKYPDRHEFAGDLMPVEEQTGYATMQWIAAGLSEMGCKTRMIRPKVDPDSDGWDAADALAEGWDADQVIHWIKQRLEPIARKPADEDEGGEQDEESEPDQEADQGPSRVVAAQDDSGQSIDLTPQEEAEMMQFQSWEKLGLDLNQNGAPLMNLNNAAIVLEGHPMWRSKIWYDEFHQKHFTNWNGEIHEWSDDDTLQATLWMQRALGLTRMTDRITHQAMLLVAHNNIHNEPREWMGRIEWDGVPRITDFLAKYFGADDSEYMRAVAKNFWIGMAARIYRPGCKVDNMMVLESDQGAGKSSALAVIGGNWYSEAHESVTSKDFYMTLQGKLLVEIGEMDAFSRAETTKVKQVMTCTTDRYRAPYERAPRDYPRQNIFVGTTNDDSYLKDSTGARRFWPVRCGKHIDVEGLARDRMQLFAEAAMMFKRGDTWWHMPYEATREEQERRRDEDVWEHRISDYLRGRQEVTIDSIMESALDIEIKNQDRRAQLRVGNALRALGWEKTVKQEGHKRTKVWRPRLD